MKKLIALVTLMFAFTISANAQDKKMSSSDAAQKDVAALNQKVTLSESLKKDMYTLMVMKYDALEQATTPEAKENISKTFGHKLMSGLTEEQRVMVEKDKDLLKQLTQ